MGRGIVMLVGAVVEGGLWFSERVCERVWWYGGLATKEVECGRCFGRVDFYGDEKD